MRSECTHTHARPEPDQDGVFSFCLFVCFGAYRECSCFVLGPGPTWEDNEILKGRSGKFLLCQLSA